MKKHYLLMLLSICVILLLPTVAFAAGFRHGLAQVLGFFGAFVGLILGWIIFPFTLSFINVMGKSPISLFASRLGGAATGAFFGWYIIFTLVAGHEPSERPRVIANAPQIVTQSTQKKNAAEISSPTTATKMVANEEQSNTGEVHNMELTSTVQFPAAGQISASNVNMRSGHSILAQRLATLPRGQNVTVLGNWVADSDQEAILKKDLYVEVDGKTKTLGKGKAVSLAQHDASEGKYLVSLQDKSGTISGWTSEANVKSLKGALWYKVSTPSGKTGWVLGEFLSIKE